MYRAGQITWTDKLPAASEYAIAGGAESRAPWLPRIAGVANDGPYMRSPDGKLLLAGAGTSYSGNSRLLIVDLETNEIRARVESEEDWGIGSVAWSPDGRYVAVIKAKMEFTYCLLDILTYLVGQPSGRLTVALEIFDRAGNRTADMLLVSDSPNWRAVVVWIE